MPVRFEVENVGDLGVIEDIHDYALPPNAWSRVRNVRTDKHDLVSFLGNVEVTTAPDPIYGLFPVSTPIQHYWVYAGASKAGVFDGTSHEDITPAAPFTGGLDDIWTGCIINGKLCLNNEINAPVYWDPAPGNDLQALPGWSIDDRCSVLRAHKGFLVALGMVQAGVEYPFRVKWSHIAPPGDVPQSWDITDPSLLAGERDISEAIGSIVTGEPLRDVLLIYTEGQTYGLTYIGGTFVWRVTEISLTSGALSPRSVQTIRTIQLAVTEDDIVQHDGQRVDTLVNRRMREWFFNNLDPDNARRTFVVENTAENEVWICFPESGEEYPNLALVWNYLSNTWGVRELPTQCMTMAKALDIEGLTTLTWDTNPFIWSTWAQRWNERQYRATNEVLIGGSGSQIHRFDATKQFNGVDRTAFAERLGLRLDAGGVKGPDAAQTVVSIWPRADGDPFEVRVGAQDRIDGPVAWQEAVLFRPGQDYKVDVRSTGRYTAVRFQSRDEAQWRLHGYGIEYERAGDR